MLIGPVQKTAIDYAISLNPTIVTISRVQYTEDAGARKKATSTVAAQTWLVYQDTHRTSGKNRDEGGMVDDFQWTALAPSTADVQWGPNASDKFTIAGVGTFEVESGRPIMIGSVLNGYHLSLKEVK